MKIPIENVYYLLLYAWDHFEAGEEVDVNVAGITRLQDLFGHVLAGGCKRLLARGLDRDYVPVEEAVGGVRGKIDLSATLGQALLVQARTHCRFDELSHDVPQNQILKATLGNLLLLDDLDDRVRASVRRVYHRFEGVTAIQLNRGHFRRVRIHRNNRIYAFLLKLCLLIHDNLMIDQESGQARFPDFRDDEVPMWKLFEDFVRNFFHREQSRFRVSRPQINWFDAQGSEADLARLPRMETDVVLESPDRCIILDAKFYTKALRGYRGEKKVASAHLYQLFAYLENRSAAIGPLPVHEGILLYPAVDDHFAFDFRLKGHRIRVCSIDLGQPWMRIRGEMLALLE